MGLPKNKPMSNTNSNSSFSSFQSTNINSSKSSFDWLTTLLLCLFLGVLGVHSFYTKKTGIGVAQLLTLGGCGIWALIDLISIVRGTFKDGNGNIISKK